MLVLWEVWWGVLERARILTHWYESLLFLPLCRAVRAVHAHILAPRRARTESGDLFGCDSAVTRKEDDHEHIELHETLGVYRIPRRRHFIVDRGEIVVRGKVFWELSNHGNYCTYARY